MNNLTTKGKEFYLGKEPFRIISGAIHYFRVMPQYWEDRLKKLKACGFNTVETYVAWNVHEPNEGEFCFDGMYDLEKFIQTATKLGLYAIIRPGPYICAEWEFGGFPAWLIRDKNMKLRCNYAPYLQKVDAYFDVLIPKLVPYLTTNGGNILAVQVENEYGSYGNDKQYLEHIKVGLITRGINVLLFTSDGDSDSMLVGGTVEGVHKMVNFGSDAKRNFDSLKRHQEDAPLMCCEFWNGWFDHWGDKHITRDSASVAETFDEMLSMGASVNFYMFHGGTNFGFTNGANRYDVYEPTVSSYDYDSLLSESGDMTEKYFKCKEIIEKHFGSAEEIHVENSKKIAYGKIDFTLESSLFDNLDSLSTKIHSAPTLTMEETMQNTGFILYRTFITGPMEQRELIIQDVADRAVIFADGKFLGTVYRDHENEKIMVEVKSGTLRLDILVENMGRTNYGAYMQDNKGITQGVRLGNQFLFGWDIYPLPMTDLSKIEYQNKKIPTGPKFLKGEFDILEQADTFLKLDGFTKGIAYVNGFNLGRYWSNGPTKTLYVPAPILKNGKNVVEIFEIHGNDVSHGMFVDAAEL